VPASAVESESESESVSDSVSVSESEEVSDNLERETVGLGETAQESLVNRICDLYAEENGEEATTNDLRDIFAEVKRMFAEEAELEQYDETDEEQSEDEEQEELSDESVNGEELTDEESVDALETFVVETSDNDMDETVRDTFESEMETALDTVRLVAKEHQADFIDTISDLYADLHGEQPSLQDLSDILEEIQAEFAEEAEFEIFYSDEFAADFELALEHTREVAASHRESLVNSICDIFSEMNGKEATAEDLSGIFDRIKQTFAQEAEEQFLEIHENDSENDSEDEDSDYNPDSDAFDYSLDAADDECASVASSDMQA